MRRRYAWHITPVGSTSLRYRWSAAGSPSSARLAWAADTARKQGQACWQRGHPPPPGSPFAAYLPPQSCWWCATPHVGHTATRLAVPFTVSSLLDPQTWQHGVLLLWRASAAPAAAAVLCRAQGGSAAGRGGGPAAGAPPSGSHITSREGGSLVRPRRGGQGGAAAQGPPGAAGPSPPLPRARARPGVGSGALHTLYTGFSGLLFRVR